MVLELDQSLSSYGFGTIDQSIKQLTLLTQNPLTLPITSIERDREPISVYVPVRREQSVEGCVSRLDHYLRGEDL